MSSTPQNESEIMRAGAGSAETPNDIPTAPTATPGPWTAYGRGINVMARNPYGRGDMMVADIRGWGHLTGRGGGCAFDEEKAADIQDANAHLIAAAPELLAALKAMVASYDGIRDSLWNGVVKDKLAVADAAIKKAEAR